VSIHLPHVIDLYVKLENSDDVAALAECFAADATVRDEGRTYSGLAAIEGWKTAAKRRYNHSVAPLAVVDRDGKIVLKAELSGTFPGSPVTVEFSFIVKDNKIVALEINP
jgi:hypothetical protein